eukprot:3353108-Lingulodinium_polyedra.AAC.1
MLRAGAAAARGRRSARAGAAGAPAGARLLRRVLRRPLAQRLPGCAREPFSLHPGREGGLPRLLGQAGTVARFGRCGRRRPSKGVGLACAVGADL